MSYLVQTVALSLIDSKEPRLGFYIYILSQLFCQSQNQSLNRTLPKHDVQAYIFNFANMVAHMGYPRGGQHTSIHHFVHNHILGQNLNSNSNFDLTHFNFQSKFRARIKMP